MRVTGYLAFVGLSIGGVVVSRLPRRLAYRLADVIGVIASVVARPARRAVRRNLLAVAAWPVTGVARASLDVEVVARRIFTNQTRNYVDLLRIPITDPAAVAARTSCVGWASVERALGRGRGLILVGGHLGNVDAVVQAAIGRSLAVTMPVEPLTPPRLMRRVCALRSCHGLRVVPTGETAYRECRAALSRGEVVALGVDRPGPADGVEVSLFGRRTRLSVAAALLALRSGSPIIPVRCQRSPDGGYRVEFADPIDASEPDRAGIVSPRERARWLTQRIAVDLERFIAAAPDQWVMFADVWPASGHAIGQPDAIARFWSARTSD